MQFDSNSASFARLPKIEESLLVTTIPFSNQFVSVGYNFLSSIISRLIAALISCSFRIIQFMILNSLTGGTFDLLPQLKKNKNATITRAINLFFTSRSGLKKEINQP